MNILHIDSSLLGPASVSRRLTADVVRDLKASQSEAVVTYRDLVARPVAHLTAELLGGLRPAPGSAPVADEALLAEVDATETLIAEFLAADVVVIGAPMYNFSLPTQLKAWIDRLAQPGRTFRYTATGPVGLAGGKKVIVVSSRGGALRGTPHEVALDHQEAYLRTVLRFFGVEDIHYVRAEGLAMGPERKEQALAEAARDIALVRAEVRKAA